VRRALAVLAAGAIAFLVLLAPEIASAQTPTPVGTVMAVSGKVTVTRLAAIPRTLKFGDTLYPHDVIETHKGGIARILLGGKTTVTVRELSRLELRDEAHTDGVRYTVELMAGKVRASVARALMRSGEQVEVRTRNAVASVRGTDFIVEAAERPAPAGAFGLVAARDVGERIPDGGARSDETVVVTLAGAVEVANPLAGANRAERIRTDEAARISGRGEPIRLQVQGSDVESLLEGLTPARLYEAGIGR
jgi:hypothetical protein